MTRVNISSEWKVLGAVLDAFNSLESDMAEAIAGYIQPAEDRAEFVRRQLLHNSSIAFGSKVKLVLAIAKAMHGPELKRDDFHRLLHIRNALAHGDTASLRRENANALCPLPYGEYLVIETLKGDGSVEEKPRGPAMAEFMLIFERLQTQIRDLNGKLRQQ